MWYLKLQYLIPSAFCLSSEIVTATLTAKVLKCTGVISEMQLFNVPSVIKIPLAVKMLRDLSLPQANGKCLNGWSYTLRGLPVRGMLSTVSYCTLQSYSKTNILFSVHFML